MSWLEILLWVFIIGPAVFLWVFLWLVCIAAVCELIQYYREIKEMTQ